MFLEEMKTTDFKEGERYVFVIPTGSTEQHGPFLPLGTDSYIQDAVVRGVEKKFPELIFLPTMRITCSEEHEGFPGSTWISLETMEAVLLDICRSLKGFAKQFIFTTAHGGNVALLSRFVEEHQDQFPEAKLSYIDLDSDELERKTVELIEGPVDDHAGNTEISLMLNIREDLTRVPPSDYPKRSIEGPFKTNRLKDFSKDGIADNHPAWVVDASHGEKILGWIIQDFAEEVARVLVN